MPLPVSAFPECRATEPAQSPARRVWQGAVIVCAAIMLSGCATTPPSKIHTELFGKPLSVAIVDVPTMRNVARIQEAGVPIIGMFSDVSDTYFVVERAEASNENTENKSNYSKEITENQRQQSLIGPPTSVKTAMVGGAVAGVVGGIIQASVDDTHRKAQTYHAEVLARVPGYDLRSDLLKALQTSLETEGVRTFVVDGRAAPPRLRWPATDPDGRVHPSDPEGKAPAVDADILMQICPISLWLAPGPLNNFRRVAYIGVALYNGRTKQFLGMQWFVGSATETNAEYITYNSLLEDSPRAAAALRETVLTIVPKVTAVVSKRSATASH